MTPRASNSPARGEKPTQTPAAHFDAVDAKAVAKLARPGIRSLGEAVRTTARTRSDPRLRSIVVTDQRLPGLQGGTHRAPIERDDPCSSRSACRH